MGDKRSSEKSESSSKEKSAKTKANEKSALNASRNKKKSRVMTYSKFMNIPHNEFFLFEKRAEFYLGMVSGMRSAIVQYLKERPLGQATLYRLLEKINPDYPMALDYILGNAGCEASIQKDRCSAAVEELTQGIEIRSTQNRNYWGLISKLDSG